MIECLTAPTERPPFSQLGPTSSLPEKFGVDVMWSTRHGTAGLQRKEVMDLVASVRDGRLGKELVQMSSLSVAFLCVEGTPAWDREGNLQSQHTRWTRRQHWGVMLSIQSQGVMVLETRNALETCSLVEYLCEWSDKEERTSSLLARPGPTKNGWGRMDDRGTAIHVLSGLPGISTELATRMYDAFGRAPIGLTVTKEQLLAVDGLGPKRVDSIVKALS